MNSKVFVLLGLLFVVVFLISSATAVETSKDEKNLDVGKETNQVGDAKAANLYCHHGCCRSGGRGCLRCCRDAEEARLMASETKPEKQEETNPVNDEKHHGWGGGYGGGRGGWGGRCCGKEKESATKP